MSGNMSVCLFCCKGYKSDENSCDNESTEVLQTFLKILQRQLNTKFETFIASKLSRNIIGRNGELNLKGDSVDIDNHDINTLRLAKACIDCLRVVRSICDIYHELKCLEMRLQWRLGVLNDIMDLAGKVPARTVTLKTICDTNDKRSQSKEPRRQGRPRKSFNSVINFRQEVQNKCCRMKNKVMQKYPKVSLAKLKLQSYHAIKSHLKDAVKTAENVDETHNINDDSHQGGVEIELDPFELGFDLNTSFSSSLFEEIGLEAEDRDANTYSEQSDVNLSLEDPIGMAEEEPEPGPSEKVADCDSSKSEKENESGANEETPTRVEPVKNDEGKARVDQNWSGNGKEFICEHCGKGFKYAYNMRRHYVTHTGPEVWKFVCDTCGKKCTSLDTLMLHSKQHKSFLRCKFYCEVCGRKFPSRYKLTAHASKHTNELPFKCMFCSSKFTVSRDLIVHLNRKHTEKRLDEQTGDI